MIVDLAPYTTASIGGRDIVPMQRDIPPILQQFETLGVPRRLYWTARRGNLGEIRLRSIMVPDLAQNQHLRVELQNPSKNT